MEVTIIVFRWRLKAQNWVAKWVNTCIIVPCNYFQHHSANGRCFWKRDVIWILAELWRAVVDILYGYSDQCFRLYSWHTVCCSNSQVILLLMLVIQFINHIYHTCIGTQFFKSENGATLQILHMHLHQFYMQDEICHASELWLIVITHTRKLDE